MVTSGAAPLIVNAFRRVRRYTSIECAKSEARNLMGKGRNARTRVNAAWQKQQKTVETCNAGRACSPSTIQGTALETDPRTCLRRIKQERVPTSLSRGNVSLTCDGGSAGGQTLCFSPYS